MRMKKRIYCSNTGHSSFGITRRILFSKKYNLIYKLNLTFSKISFFFHTFVAKPKSANLTSPFEPIKILSLLT